MLSAHCSRTPGTTSLVESVVRDIGALTRDAYQALALHPNLRKLPDLLVMEPTVFSQGNDEDGGERHWLVEVKYRASWKAACDNGMWAQIAEQAKVWSPLHLVLILGDVPPKFRGRRNHVLHRLKVFRIDAPAGDDVQCDGVPLSQPDSIELDLGWRFQDIFARVGPRWKENTLSSSLKVIDALESLGNKS
jgi:hypothetical protein